MKIRVVFLAALLFACLPAAPALSEFYRYTDSSGTVHYTDNLLEVPEDQRPGVDTYESVSSGNTGPLPPVSERLGLSGKGAKKDDDKQEQAQKEEAEEENKPDPMAARRDELLKKKAKLQAEYDQLLTEGEELKAWGRRLHNKRAIRIHNQKVSKYNERKRELENKISALKEEIDRYNRQREAGKK
ncbi:MAG: DUF4124 domain-containing protein [Deltaproteobacteria bacterium]|nr:DUF4124 domain-containing protein [Deltaproteobacteria bacterium]